MNKVCDNRYKLCRITANIKRETAAEFLHISSRSLYDYENGAKVPDDVVAGMAKLYKAPLLAWWHLKENSILGEYLPDIIMPQTGGDMAFQLVLAEDQLTPIVKEIKKIMSNGKVDPDEKESFESSLEMIRCVNAKLFSVIVYGEQLKSNYLVGVNNEK